MAQQTDINSLELYIDGKTKSFREWTADFVNDFYPEIGQRCYRVPPLHFNQQRMTARAEFDGFQLDNPDKDHSRGELAQTLVLESMERLGQDLQVQGKPLFVISTLDFDNYLAKVKVPSPREGKSKGTKRKTKTKHTEQSCSHKTAISLADSLTDMPSAEHTHLTKKGKQTKTQATLEKMVQGQLPPKPRDIGDIEMNRGDIDVILLHPECGTILMEVKSVGMPQSDWEYTEQDYHEKIDRAIKQVQKSCRVFKFIMPDIVCNTAITLAVALPFMTRELLDKILPNLSLDVDVVFLCQDDMVSNSWPKKDVSTSPGDCDINKKSAPSVIMNWWKENIIPRGSSLNLSDMKTIVGRVCGLMSIVSVWTRNRPRVEIRTTAQAINETAHRISDIVLLPQQAALLAKPSPSRVCMTGPMGSGKTLMLQLKGRQWVVEGKRVVVLNVRSSGKGRPVGHVLEEAIRRGDRGHDGEGTVERYDLASREFDIAKFHAELEKGGPTDNISFILDELTHYTFLLLEQLIVQYPQCSIWCVAMFIRDFPQGFQHFRLGAVLRSPPSVQLLLKELDLNRGHKNVYSIRSAPRGLPCDGPCIIFIHHQRHDSTIRPVDCEQCADELVDNMRSVLGLEFSGENAKTKLCSLRGSKRPQLQAEFAKKLSFRDVLFLICMPLAYYKQKENDLWLVDPRDVIKFCEYLQSCTFLAKLKVCGVPIKFVIDNTLREIAIPLADEIIVTDVMGVQGLERKVVIHLPGGPVLSSESVVSNQEPSCTTDRKVSLNIKNPTTVSATALNEKSEACGPVSVSLPDCQSQSLPKVSPAARSNEIGNAKKDSNGPVQPSMLDCGRILNSSIKDMSDVSRVLGNMMVCERDSNSKPIQHQTSQNHKDHGQHAGVQARKPRMGMNVRGDSPWLQSELDDAQSALEQDNSDYPSADSFFQVPDAREEVNQREEELQRIRGAISSLSMDDQDWLFVAAARCLSQLIVIIPSPNSSSKATAK